LWLLPRLARFRALYPEIDLRLVVGTTLVDLADGKIDVAVRFGSGDYAGRESRFLMGDGVIPVCAPSLLAGRPVPRRIGELAELPLLHDDGLAPGERRLTWADWLEGGPPQVSIHMPDGLLTLQAALLGEGVALARRSMVADHLQAGRLVRLLEEERATDFGYWLVTPPGEQVFRVTAFIEWMHSEARNGVGDAG
jgi:LysR family glycine cleavage system transcriptional activator